MPDNLLASSQNEPQEVTAAATLIPYRRDDIRSKYLGYLCCGFSDEEALFVLGMAWSWLELMREDTKFSDLELRVPEFRKELSREYTELDFYRNYRMVLEKDHRVLRKALDMDLDSDGEPVEMSMFDQQYLLRLRSVYTPQQLQLLQSVITGSDDNFNFSDWVSKNQQIIQLSQTNTVTIAKRQGG